MWMEHTMNLHLYNTLTRQKQVFQPIDPQHIRLYMCGPTVYDFAHIGNARPVVAFDILIRLLKLQYPRVTYVRNLTDVDDKINKAAAMQGVSIDHLTQRTTAEYQADMRALHTIQPDIEPRATMHIPEMIDMIQSLIARGHAYAAEGHVLFSVATFPDYGQFSRRKRDELIAGARVEIAPYKQAPEDFVLWKPSDSQTPGWPSPWGRGRPGWHIECSAMSAKHLGSQFDIHLGGADLIFPHHENEIAQSRACYGTSSMANYWLHNGHLTVDGEKMSKSLGNFITVRQALTQAPGEVVRLALLSTHYHQPLNWSEHLIQQSRAILDRFYGILRWIEDSTGDAADVPADSDNIDPQVLAALQDDLNVPAALTRLHEMATQLYQAKESAQTAPRQTAHAFRASAMFLGFLNHTPQHWRQGVNPSQNHTLQSHEVEAAILERQQARDEKRFSDADRIRQKLLQAGILLEDTSQGTQWRRR